MKLTVDPPSANMRCETMSRKSKALEFEQDVYDIHVTGRGVQVTDAMKDYAIEKISKIERFSDRIVSVNIIMEIQKLSHRVEIILKVNNLKIVGTGESGDMYVSIDMAVNKLHSQLLKYKSRLQNHQARRVSAVDMNVNVIELYKGDDDLTEVNDEIDDENNNQLARSFSPHKIISRETKPLKMLTAAEAVMKIELSQDPFLVYRSEEDQKIKVIYRRKDGNLGVLEPE